MATSVMVRTRRRPIRSPRAPKNSPPMGRTTNATPNVANVASMAVTGLLPGKNSWEKMTAVRP